MRQEIEPFLANINPKVFNDRQKQPGETQEFLDRIRPDVIQAQDDANKKNNVQHGTQDILHNNSSNTNSPTHSNQMNTIPDRPKYNLETFVAVERVRIRTKELSIQLNKQEIQQANKQGVYITPNKDEDKQQHVRVTRSVTRRNRETEERNRTRLQFNLDSG